MRRSIVFILILLLFIPLITPSITLIASGQEPIVYYGRVIPGFVLESIPQDTPLVMKEGILLSYIIASEGIVLLKNKDNALPLKPGELIAVFGQAQSRKWNYHVGGSSFVKIPENRLVTPIQGLINAGFKIDPFVLERYSTSVEEFPFSENEIREIAERSNVAIIFISRPMSEGKDLQPGEGGYYLTPEEKTMIDTVSKYFNKTIVVLNTGCAIDLSWDNDNIDAIIWVGYPGEQGGNALAAILAGYVNPSGHLPFTWAHDYWDYPSSKYFLKFGDVVYWEDIYVGYRYFDTFNIEPKYPFGYGLSYTVFEIKVVNVTVNGSYITLNIVVKNTGSYPGREVIQVYVSPPQGILDKPYQQLVAYAKTDLLQPGEFQVVSITFDITTVASYSEELSAWILERGVYIIRVGNSSRNTSIVATLELPETVIVEDTVNRMHAPVFDRLRHNKTEIYLNPYEKEELKKAPRFTLDPASIPTRNITHQPIYYPEALKTPEANETITLRSVLEGKYTLEELIGQMNVSELAELVVGLNGVKSREIPGLRHADGPNGIVQGPTPNPGGVAYPSATIVAATWDTELTKIYGYQVGREMIYLNIQLLLGPGLNIIRNPLLGRAGEYYSEDPLLAGTMAASFVKGLQSHNGIGATLKHLVGNEQEFNRYNSNSVISERALREIYLKAFEIAVKASQPWAIMTSYNRVNGIYTGNDFNLCMGIVRTEWGFNGFIMTDWGSGSYNPRALAAGNDALMPYSAGMVNNVINAVNTQQITLGQLQRSALNILRVITWSLAISIELGIQQSYVYNPPPDYFIVAKESPRQYIGELQTTSRVITETTSTSTPAISTTITLQSPQVGIAEIPIWVIVIAISLIVISISMYVILRKGKTR